MKENLNSKPLFLSSFLTQLKKKPNLIIAVGFLILSLILIFFFISPPFKFHQNTLLTISEGLSIKEAGNVLKSDDIIKSSFVFNTLVRLSGKSVIAGDYFFEKPNNIVAVAYKITTGEFNIKPVRITIFEGESSFEMADRLGYYLPRFDKEKFVSLAQNDEGYLFPDTYFFSPNVTEKTIIETLKTNFSEKIKSLDEELAQSERSQEDIIIMAALLEREARDFETKKIISGILWKRLDEGMRLQVDAVFPYIIGKNTFEVTLDDLEFDSPYNTYKYAGLPAGPISNPGLDSIEAALFPIESDSWYYLADLHGITHFAVTFEEHKINKFKYLP